MKIEFVKEVDVDDSEWYYTQKDGKYISGSGSINRDTAYAYFLKYVSAACKKKVETILETIEIEAQ